MEITNFLNVFLIPNSGYIGDNTIADAIMDRLINNAIHIELKGESMRGRRKKHVTPSDM